MSFDGTSTLHRKLVRSNILQPIRIVRSIVLGIKLHGRAAKADGDISTLIDIAMTTSVFGTTIAPMQRVDELESFLRLVAGYRPRYCLEIGTSAGGTLFLLCRVSSPDALILSVDLPGGAGGISAFKKDRERLYRSFALERQRVITIRGDSHQPETRAAVALALGSNLLDLLIIDGDRRYEGVKADWQDYEPLVRSGGLIALHDICRGHPNLGDQVFRFWEEVSEDKDAAAFITRGPEPGYGFGVIRKE